MDGAFVSKERRNERSNQQARGTASHFSRGVNHEIKLRPYFGYRGWRRSASSPPIRTYSPGALRSSNDSINEDDLPRHLEMIFLFQVSKVFHPHKGS